MLYVKLTCCITVPPRLLAVGRPSYEVMAKFVKQRHGHPNPILKQEEISLLAALDRTQHSTSNSQILGRNGEKALIGFLNRHLPATFHTTTGHFVTPSGVLSPEIDVLVLDARYPFLAKNDDGSVVAMLHSVLAAIEVKLTLTKIEIGKIRKNSTRIEELSKEVFPDASTWESFFQTTFAYKTRLRLQTVANHFFENWSERGINTGIELLRIPETDHFDDEGPLGASIWLEGGEQPTVATTISPLSDLYYRLTQNSFYILSSRGYEFGDLGQHMMEYMNWGTYPCLNRGAI